MSAVATTSSSIDPESSSMSSLDPESCSLASSITRKSSPVSVFSQAGATQLRLQRSSTGIVHISSPEVLGESVRSKSIVDEEKIREKAKLYSKEDKRPLSSFQQAINKAAGDICVEDPVMLNKKGDLLALARQQVYESGFHFKKGKSRSKVFGEKTAEPVVKRLYVNKEVRKERMTEIERDLERLNEGIQYKLKRRSAAENSKNYKLCEDLTDQIRESEREARRLKVELKNYQTKEKRSLSYQKRMSTSSSESESYLPASRRPRLVSSDSGGSTEILGSSPSHSAVSEELGVQSPFEPSQYQVTPPPIDLRESSPLSDVSGTAFSPVLFPSQGDRWPGMSSPGSISDRNDADSSGSSQPSVDDQPLPLSSATSSQPTQDPNASLDPLENFQ